MTEPLPVEALLAPADLKGRLAALRRAGLDGAAGLNALLDAAAELAAGDPRRGRHLAELCVAAAAAGAGTDGLVPRGQYAQAQAAAREGRLDEALGLIEAAHDGWRDRGEHLRALRTRLGRMHVENEAGRHDDALATGASVLAELERLETAAPPTADGERLGIRAMAHQNLGMTYGFTGRWSDLLAECGRAETLFTAAGLDDRTPALQENSGIALVHLGRVTEALDEFAAAVAGHRRQGNALAEGACLIESGRARMSRGEYRIALDVLAEAAAVLEPLGPVPDRDWLRVSRGDAYLALNLLDAAIAEYEGAEAAFRPAGLSYDLALALSGHGAALARAHRPAEAERILTEALTSWESAGNVPMHAATLLELADLRAAAGARDDAVALVRRGLAVLAAGRWPVEEFLARLRLADLVLPDLDLADHELAAAASLSEAAVLPQLRYRLDERVGRLRLLQGREADAVAALERAIATVEDLRGALPRESMRASFLRDKLEAHSTLIGLWLDRGDDESLRRAFELAERAKSQSLLDLMRGAVSARTTASEADPRVQRLRSLQADLDAVYNALLGDDDPGDTRGGAGGALRERAGELERAIERLRLEVPVGDARIPPSAVPVLPRLHADLAGVTVLAYHVLGEEIVAFACGPAGLAVVREVSTVPRVQVLLDRLAGQWARFRAGAALADRHADRLVATARRVLGDLYAELVAPVEQLLGLPSDGRTGRLAVVPHGLLHRVPFHALHDGHRHLLERAEVTCAPSATVLSLLRTPRDPDGPALVLAVHGPSIPAVAREADEVAAALPGAVRCTGQEATVAALRAHTPGSHVVHLACHGLFRPENPMFSALRLHDGWLTAADALTLDVDGALVVLSACESGASRTVGGGDEVIGLPRAFLGAGASAVVVSLWLAEDAPTAELMREMYARLRAGEGPAAALRAAQLAHAVRYPHPYHWAPFTFVGAPIRRPEEPL